MQAVHAHAADDEAVHAREEHLHTEEGTAVDQEPPTEDLIFEGQAQGLAQRDLFGGQTLILGVAVLLPLLDEEQGDEHGKHEGDTGVDQGMDVHIQPLQHHGDQGIDQAVGDGIEEGLIARHTESLGLVGTDRGEGAVESDETHGVAGEEDEVPEEHPEGIEQAVLGLYGHDPGQHEAHQHGEKAHRNSGAAAAPFGGEGVGDVGEGDVDDAVENLTQSEKNGEQGRKNEAEARHDGLELFTRLQGGGVQGVGVVGAHENHEEVGAKAREGKEEFLPFFVQRRHHIGLLTVFGCSL